MGCPPHWPHQLGSSEMTPTITQHCLESTELGLTIMAAASACSKFCWQQKHVSAQVPTLDEGAPLRAWSLPGQPVLPGLSPSRPACSPLGCGHSQPPSPQASDPHRPRLARGRHTPRSPHPHRQGKDSGFPGWDGRGDTARPGAPVLPFRSFAKRATGLSGASGATVERDATRSAAELSRGDGLWEGANNKTS